MPLSRRSVAAGLATFGATAPLIPLARLSASELDLDLSNPKDNVYAIVKIQGDVSGKTSYSWGHGHIFGLMDGQMARPLLRYQSCRVGEYRPTDDDGFVFRYRGMIFYQDYETGAFIDEFRNPFTGEACSVKHFKTSIGQYTYTKSGPVAAGAFDGETGHSFTDGYVLPWERAGDRIWVTLDERVRYRRPSDGAMRVDNALLRYETSWGDLVNPDLTAAETSSSFQTQLNWFEWLNMGGRPGMIMQGGAGHKFMSIDQLPSSFVDFAESTFPGSVTGRITWDV